MAGDLLAVAALGLLILLAFWLIGPAGRVLAGGDLFTYFYPYWAEATRAIRAGRLPLWNPYLFMGVPFLANSQVGMFYPLNWLLWLLLPPHRSLHWSVLLHLWLAGAGIYAYARGSLRLGRLGAWTAGVALSLGGYLGAQVEHINQLQALSWFPWLLLFFDRVNHGGTENAEKGEKLCALRASVVSLPFVGLAAGVGMVLLTGHTQSAFIVLVGLAVYGLGPSLWAAVRGRGWRPLARRSAVWAGAAAVGVALAAAQLLPTFQLTRLSVRAGGLPFNERVSFSLSPVYLARALLPGYVRPVEPENIEFVATVGVAGLLLAARGWWGGDHRRIWPVLLLTITGLFLALGLYNPAYLVLARFMPGFAHFRAPARWLALWAVGGAALVGMGVEAALTTETRRTRSLRGGPGISRHLSVSSVSPWFFFASFAVFLVWGAVGGRVAPLTLAVWVATAALAVAAMRWRRPAVLTALVVAELTLSARTLPRARATAPQAYTSLRPAVAHLLAAGEGKRPPDRFLSLSALAFDPGDLPELRLIYGDQLSPDALYDLIVAAKHREVLSPNLPLAFRVPAVDGYDGGVLPLARYLALQRAFLPEEAVAIDGRLRENLTEVPDGRWLSLLNVRYVITDKVFDAWLDGVFYDLQFGGCLAAGETATVAYVPPFEGTALGLVSYLEGAGGLADGTEVGEVTVGFTDGTVRTFLLRAGVETAEGLYGPGVAHSPATVGGHFWPGQPEGNDYVARLRWEGPGTPVSVTVRATLPEGKLVVRGVSLIDERTGSFQSLVLSDRGRFRLVHSGDVKVYENLDVLPRAFVARRVSVVGSEEEALARMQSPDFDPTAEVVIEGGPDEAAPASGEETAQVRVVTYGPERVEIEAELEEPGYLVLTDANYPGWRAWVDGEEAEVRTADLLFRALRLEPGRHRVLFLFQPWTVRAGLGISLLAWVGLFGLFLICGYNRRKDGRTRRRGDAGTRRV